jgi:hypothetical protein
MRFGNVVLERRFIIAKGLIIVVSADSIKLLHQIDTKDMWLGAKTKLVWWCEI